jgi:trans-2-enoyl-CoA reductase
MHYMRHGVPLLVVALLPIALAGFVIDTNTGYWINTQTNATTIFHGVNAVMKAFPWHPRIDSFNPSDSLAEQVRCTCHQYLFVKSFTTYVTR